MKKNPLKILAILVGVTGAYFIYKYIKGAKNKGIPTPEVISPSNVGGGSSVTPKPIPPSPKLNEPSKTAGSNFIVKTVSATGKLNVRTLPITGAGSKVLYQINNGETVKAQKSSISGWHEILDTSKSFPIVIGYVSSTYLVPKA